MPLAAGSRLGAYDVVAPLGAGGMGEVYRARDTKLGRDVAIKVLPASFTDDPDRLARFQREAQILASLNHPNIAAIYGLEQPDTTPFLVLELVEGETLDARVKDSRTGLPVDEALGIARQIADALEAAHEKGIVHRDLKPANVAITGDGVVKVLDFGLAKAMERGPGGDQSQSPTITFAATQAGIILGTAAYMSPEQAKGRVADKRADVWAFGCVLFEMLTGRRAFEGEDITETIAAIVRGEPAWSALPVSVPPQIRLLLLRCLEKDRRARVGDIAVARFLMTETIAAAAPSTSAPLAVPDRRRRTALATAIGIAGGAAVTALVALAWLRPAPPPARLPARFQIVPPASQALVLQGADRNLDIAQDGSFIVYRGASQATPELFIRALNDVDARPLAGSAGGDPRTPFISPDGRWVGFFAGQDLKKVLISGGAPISLCRISSTPRGATWAPDGTIVFATNDPNGGLLTVSASGGEPRTLVKPAFGTGRGYGFPSVLPDGNTVLFQVGSPGASPETVNLSDIAALNRRTGEQKTLIHGGSHPLYAGGFLVYGAAGTLRAVRFDPRRLAVSGEPVPVVQQVTMSALGAANFALSRDGSIVYVPSTLDSASAPARSLVWVTRDGREEPLKLPARPYEGPRLSPDGSRIALAVIDGPNDIWIGDIRRETLTRLTFDPATDQTPVWTPDGKQIIWSSQTGNGTPNLYRQAADGGGSSAPLTARPHPTFSTSISPDGRYVIGWENSPGTRQDIIAVDLNAGSGSEPRPIQPLVHTPAIEVDAEISPDGRWLAYQSDESGRPEIYARPFPNVDAGRWQISTNGGSRAVWAHSGKELFYLDAGGFLTSVPVEARESTISPGNAARVLSTKYYQGFTGLGLDLRGYDVARDDRRFLMIKAVQSDRDTNVRGASMIVVLNWLDELKTRIP
jgi:eukaryotic-like serine/threonine-protein kinase